MATRFKLPASGSPAVSPSFQSYTHSVSTRRTLPTSDSSTLATTATAPDGSDHLVAGDACFAQFVSLPMSAGITFTNGQTIKCAIQCLEAHANNNLFLQLFVSIVSQDGGTVRRTLRSKVADGTEINTTIQNRFHSTTQDGADYTTVFGDRLVVELSATGTPAAASQVQGHNYSLRLGASGAGGDNGENDTDTGTTLNPWIEFVPTITFATVLTATAPVTTISSPAATRTTAVSLTAGAPVTNISTPTAIRLAGITRVANAGVVVVTAPAATRVAVRTLVAGAPSVLISAPAGGITAGGGALLAGAPVVVFTAPAATRLAVTTIVAGAAVVTITVPAAVRIAIVRLVATAPRIVFSGHAQIPAPVRHTLHEILVVGGRWQILSPTSVNTNSSPETRISTQRICV